MLFRNVEYSFNLPCGVDNNFLSYTVLFIIKVSTKQFFTKQFKLKVFNKIIK